MSGFESTGIYPLDKIAMKSKLKLISDTRSDSHVKQNDNAESSDEEDSSDGESVVNDQPIVNSQTQIHQISQYGNSNASANVKDLQLDSSLSGANNIDRHLKVVQTNVIQNALQQSLSGFLNPSV